MERKVKLVCYITGILLFLTSFLVFLYGTGLVMQKMQTDYDAEIAAHPNEKPNNDYLRNKAIIYHFGYFVFMIFFAGIGTIIITSVNWYYKTLEFEKYCTNCNRTVADDSQFCSYCGEKFDN